MAQPYVQGPGLLFVGVGGGLAAKQPLFLGTAEDTPTVEIIPRWEGVVNDLGGTEDFDESYQGSRAVVRADMTRWNEGVAEAMVARPSFAGVAGFEPFGSMGALAITEGLTFPLWVVFPYATLKSAMGTMIPGYRFPFCKLQGPDVDRGGTKPRKRAFLWRALRGFDPTTGSFLLYDHNVAGMPAIN